MRAIYRLIVVAIIIGITAISSYAFSIPTLQGRVNDYAELLSQTQRTELERVLHSLEDKTTVQVAILTVKDLQGEDIKSFSLKVAEKWKLGQKGKDNGLLILYTVKEDRYRLEVGYGLEGAIPDGKAGDIIRLQLRAHANPSKGSRDFNGAFTAAVQSISTVVLAEYAKDPTGKSMRKNASPDSDALWIILCIAVLIAGVAGMVHEVFGAVVGGLEGLGVAAMYSLGTPGLIILVAVGIVLGLAAKFILGAIADSGGGGVFSGSSSSSSDSGFSGGGGGFGGGGADG